MFQISKIIMVLIVRLVYLTNLPVAFFFFSFPHLIISNQSSDIQLIVVHDDLTDLIQAIDLSDKIIWF